jgi:pilus assembly protein Flp/PilA
VSEAAFAGGRGEEAMKSLPSKVQRFLVSEDGPTAVEYAVMLALIVIVCLTAIQAIGTNANVTFNSVASKLPTGGAS